MTFRRTLPLFALFAAQTGCAADAALGPDASDLPAVKRVVVISVDGLRGDALGAMPALAAMRGSAAWTDSMETIVPSLTVPGHLAMFTGRDVSRFGITTNVLDQAAGFALLMNGATTMFQWTRSAAGSSTALLAGSLVPAADLESARTFFGVDEMVSVSADLAEIGDRAIAAATRADAPMLLFVHVPTVDFAGHDHGWIAPGLVNADGSDVLGDVYTGAVRDADALIERIRSSIAPSIENGDVALIVTSDHGGGHGEGCTAGEDAFRQHCTSQPADRLIPFVLLAKGVTAGRLGGRPTITQVAPSVGALLGLTVPGAADAPVR